MRGFIETIRQKKRAAPKSFALLLILCCASLSAFLLAFFYFHQDFFRLWPCSFRQFTGLYCPACGNTRAVEALLRFHPLESVRYNPTPLLAALFLFAVILHAAINLIKGRDRKFPHFFLWFYIILAIVLLFCILRNAGVF